MLLLQSNLLVWALGADGKLDSIDCYCFPGHDSLFSLLRLLPGT